MAPRIWDAKTWVADPTHTALTLGWRARTTIAEGMARTAVWMRREGLALTERWRQEQGS
jgi:polyisoprenyl-phosphate glycosyltransferase